MAEVSEPLVWSADRNWFWDGKGWKDAISRDGCWRFDGDTWHAFDGSRSPEPETVPSGGLQKAEIGIEYWLVPADVVRKREEAAQREHAAVIAQQEQMAAAAVAALPAPRSSATKALLWSGLALGLAIAAFGLLGFASLAVTVQSKRDAVIEGSVLMLSLGLVISAPLAITVAGYGRQLISTWRGIQTSLGVFGLALSSLGLLGCGVLLGLGINTYVAVSRPTGTGHWVFPWGTLAVIGLRAWRGRWFAALVIGVAWIISVFLILAVNPPG